MPLLKTMYPPQKDSPSTFTLGAITTSDTFVLLGNVSILPQTTPYPLTFGIDKSTTETVMVQTIDTGSNLITFTRGSAPLPWPAGTNVARVFNAQDLKDLQDNVVDINQQVETNTQDIGDMEGDLGALVVAVGDEDSGLVKGLADEIIRATAAEGDEYTRATTAEGLIDAAKPDRTELTQVITDWLYSADGTKVELAITRYNAQTKASTEIKKTIPVVTEEALGVMTPEAYSEIITLRNDVNALENQGGRFIGQSFATKAVLDAWTIPDTVNVGDFTYVLDDEDHDDATTRYVYDGVEFDFAFVVNYDPVGLANSTTPGLVLSETTDEGKINVEVDGTMSVIGWDDLVSDVEDKVDKTRTINNKALTSDISLDATDVGANSALVNATLTTTWSGTGPYTQDVAITGMTASKNATVGLAMAATSSEREAARDAILSATAQTTDQITITADGDKPTITIPISVILHP